MVSGSLNLLSESYYSLFEYKHLPSKAVSSWSIDLLMNG